MKTKCILYLYPVLFSCLLCACQKQFLAAPTDKSLVVPTTLNDFQTLLNNEPVMNISPALGVISADDYYTTDDGWQGFTLNAEKNSYLWSPDIFQGESDADWNVPYQQVFYANVVLDGLIKLKNNGGDPASYNKIKGTALFYRAHAFYQLAQLFAVPYSAESAGSQGVPIRTSSEVKTRSERGTLQQTYAQIIADLTLAGKLLPVQTAFKTRPGKAAVYGLFSRVYQTMQDYQNARLYADSCLQLNHTLVDYNTLDSTSYAPMPSPLSMDDNEVIYDSEFTAYSFISYDPLTIVDSTLYRSYSENDLRKSVFFTDNGYGAGQFNFKGSYCGSSNITSGQFGGIATDEVYLIRAECEARNGEVTAAMNDLNTLLKTRWKTGTFVAYTAADKDAALSMILSERRKELISRGLRWTDLRRLNQDSRFAVTLKRLLNGQSYTLAPGSKWYTLPIAQDEIAASGIPQNPR